MSTTASPQQDKKVAKLDAAKQMGLAIADMIGIPKAEAQSYPGMQPAYPLGPFTENPTSATYGAYEGSLMSPQRKSPEGGFSLLGDFPSLDSEPYNTSKQNQPDNAPKGMSPNSKHVSSKRITADKGGGPAITPEYVQSLRDSMHAAAPSGKYDETINTVGALKNSLDPTANMEVGPTPNASGWASGNHVVIPAPMAPSNAAMNVAHEIGHNYDTALNGLGSKFMQLEDFKGNSNNPKKGAKFVTQYAASNHAEDFAESYQRWVMGLTGSLSQSKIDFFNRYFDPATGKPYVTKTLHAKP